MTKSPRVLFLEGLLPQGQLCPECSATVPPERGGLKSHFLASHGREPTRGEVHRFANSRRKQIGKGYQVGYKKSSSEVSGGLPTLGKKR